MERKEKRRLAGDGQAVAPAGGVGGGEGVGERGGKIRLRWGRRVGALSVYEGERKMWFCMRWGVGSRCAGLFARLNEVVEIE